MRFLREKDGAYVFGCDGCMDVNKAESIQVFTSSAMKRKVRSQLRSEGRLLTEAPSVREPNYAPIRRQSIEWDGRRSKDGRYELVKFRSLPNGDIQVQMAIDGKLCPMLDDHIASRETFRTDEEYFTRIAESSETMLHLYGDARSPLSDNEVSERQNQAF